MAKQELLQNWNGQQVLSNDHVPELEQDSYLLEAQGFPRDLANQHVYQEYKRKHLIQAAAFHLKAMKAAQGMGSMQEAQKHMITYGLCVQSLGMDPYGATPPEVLAASQDPNLQIAYKFQAHPADAFLLGGSPAQPQPQGGDMGMTKHEIGYEIYKVLKKATEVLEGAEQPAKKNGPSPFEELEEKARKAGKKDELDPEQSASDPHENPEEASASDNGGAAPAQGERKCSSCGASIPFSTTLEGDDNAMGKPGAIPEVPFSAELEGDAGVKPGQVPNAPKPLGKEEFQPTNIFKIKLKKCAKCETQITKHEIGHEIYKTLVKMIPGYATNDGRGGSVAAGSLDDPNVGSLDPEEMANYPLAPGEGANMGQSAPYIGGAQDATNQSYFVQPQQQHPYGTLTQHGWTPAQTSIGPAAMKPAAGGGVYSIHNIGSRHHVIHSDMEGNITPLGIHGDTRTAGGMDLALGAIAHHELMSRGGQGQGQPGVRAPQADAAPQALMRSEISDIQIKLAPIYKSIQPLTKHDMKHNIKISRAMGGQRFIDEQGNVYNTLGEAAERLGLQASHIDEVLHGHRDQANGHTFKYVDN